VLNSPIAVCIETHIALFTDCWFSFYPTSDGVSYGTQRENRQSVLNAFIFVRTYTDEKNEIFFLKSRGKSVGSSPDSKVQNEEGIRQASRRAKPYRVISVTAGK
jgi:hypothetical protein